MKDLDGRTIPTINGFKEFDNGGKGSGNFGHAGRPGERGGSGKGGGVGDAYAKLTKKAKTEGREMVDKMTKEEIVEKFWDKKTSAEDKAKLLYGVDKLYRKEGAAKDHDAGDDLAYSKTQFLKDEIVRRTAKKNSVL